MRRFLFALVAAVAVLPGFALAQPFEPAIMLHIDEPITKSVCAAFEAPTSCEGVVTNAAAANGTQYNVYLLAATQGGLVADSFAGAELSINYTDDESDFAMLSWSMCADLEFPGANWGSMPANGADNLITFDTINNCQTDAVVVLGFFIVGAYGESMMAVGPRGVTGILGVANCSSATLTIDNERGGIAAFGGDDGCNSCLEDCFVPVREETWGGIKNTFSGE